MSRSTAPTRRPPASLLLVHGAGSGPWAYDGWREAFAGMCVSAVDLQVGLDVATACHDDHAASVAAAAAQLPAPVSVCGCSMGGLVACRPQNGCDRRA